jgi:hypothetical protein
LSKASSLDAICGLAETKIEVVARSFGQPIAEIGNGKSNTVHRLLWRNRIIRGRRDLNSNLRAQHNGLGDGIRPPGVTPPLRLDDDVAGVRNRPQCRQFHFAWQCLIDFLRFESLNDIAGFLLIEIGQRSSSICWSRRRENTGINRTFEIDNASGSCDTLYWGSTTFEVVIGRKSLTYPRCSHPDNRLQRYETAHQ